MTQEENCRELLEDYGPVPENLKERIMSETTLAVLKRWLRLAAKVQSLEEFVKEMEAEH